MIPYAYQIDIENIIARIIANCYDFYSKKIFKSIDGLIYAGNDQKDTFLLGINRRTIALGNFPWKSELFDKYSDKKEKEDRSVCYIGGITPSRGITQLVKACNKAKCIFYIAGDFISDEYKHELESLEEYESVRYLGKLDRDQIVELLQKVKIGLCVLLDVGQYYKMNNLSTKVYEYMSMHLPVILNDSPYNLEMINNYNFGICVNPYDLDSITNAISLLLERPDISYEMGEEGRKLIDKQYSWDIEQNKLISLYDSIINNYFND